ncbi:MAG: Holliday junction branch migration protein RuvA [Lachnospiraceae bacterium]|nr:Holliday junction branch migration protein RuvA [Lachnospiraceae bacterium]
MFAFVEGVLDFLDADMCVVDIGGLGINVNITSRCSGQIGSVGDHVKLYTYTQVSEDTFQLYGFDDRDDLDMFRKLVSVSGVGPKSALSLLSVMDADSVRYAVISDDIKSLSKAKGISAKTAGKIIIELKGKVDLSDDSLARKFGSDPVSVTPRESFGSEESDALAALVSLGYSESESSKAILSIEDHSTYDSGTLLSLALKVLYGK